MNENNVNQISNQVSDTNVVPTLTPMNNGQSVTPVVGTNQNTVVNSITGNPVISNNQIVDNNSMTTTPNSIPTTNIALQPTPVLTPDSNVSQVNVGGVSGQNSTQPIPVSNSVEEEEPTLAPMEGVKIAPAEDGPVNASNASTATSASFSASVSQNQTETVNNTISESTENTDTVINAEQNPNSIDTGNNVKVKKRFSFTPFLLLIIFILAGYIVYFTKNHEEQIRSLSYKCTPITASKEEIKLDLNSTLVKKLYSKVQTDIREDMAQPRFNDNMKLYLAFRTIPEKDRYESNCNLFNDAAMKPFVCKVSLDFVPRAFSEERMIQAIKELYGDDTNIPLDNAQLGYSCMGGYQYIAERGEFVQGYCEQQNAISFTVDKKLLSATSTRNTIVLEEEVKYHENEKLSLPEELKSGLYYYTFRLDMNYDYVLVNKTYNTKY